MSITQKRSIMNMNPLLNFLFNSVGRNKEKKKIRLKLEKKTLITKIKYETSSYIRTLRIIIYVILLRHYINITTASYVNTHIEYS